MLSLSQLLSKFGLDYDQLTSAEQETVNQWAKTLSERELTVEDIKNYLRQFIEAVEKELAACDLDKNRDLFLKARLRNYLMLQDLLSGPERAKKYIERQLENLKQ